MHWVFEGDQGRCLRHGTTFSKGKVCPGCVSDPGQPIDRAEPEQIDEASLADEEWCRDQRDVLMEIAKTSAGRSERSPRPPAEPGVDGQEVDGWFFWRGRWRPVDPDADSEAGLTTTAKLADTALKFHRAAVEERRRRGEHAHERWLVKKCQELARRGVTN